MKKRIKAMSVKIAISAFQIYISWKSIHISSEVIEFLKTYYEISIRLNFCTANFFVLTFFAFPTVKSPYGKYSFRRNFLTAKLTHGEIFHGEKYNGEISIAVKKVDCSFFSNIIVPIQWGLKISLLSVINYFDLFFLFTLSRTIS